MALYLINRTVKGVEPPINSARYAQRPAAERAFLIMVYDAIKAESLLDRPAGHFRMGVAKAICASGATCGRVLVGAQTVSFRKV